MRNAFINSLCDMAAKHTEIFLLCGDLGYSVLEPFACAFPDRFMNVGVAEQNMIQVAVGLSLEGYNVFTYSIGNFPTLRCLEQIRYDVAYHRANVKVVAVGSGYAYGAQGASHHTTEDLSVLRSIPNILVSSAADAVEARALAQYMAMYKGPGYVRLNKTGEPQIHANEHLQIRPGELIEVRRGRSQAVLATGAITGLALKELDDLKLDWSLFSAPFIGNYSTNTLLDIVKRFERIITFEEQQLNGGFGSSVIEALSDAHSAGLIQAMPKVVRVGIQNTFVDVSGSQEYLRRSAGLTLRSLL